MITAYGDAETNARHWNVASRGFLPNRPFVRRILESVWRKTYLTLGSLFATKSAAAQVVIPYGDFDNDFEKYLVVAITLAALVLAMWRFFRSQR